MARTTPADVRALNGSTLTDVETQSFIDTASLLIDATAGCAGVDEATLTEAEKYLTAHLMEGADGGGGTGAGAIQSESIESMSSTYATKMDNGVKSTNYGQVADMLMRGCLSKYELRRSNIAFTGGA
jgi:hypothetical protein